MDYGCRAGIVKAVDVKRGVFYISTPVPPEMLQQVDVLLQGRVEIPVPLLMVSNLRPCMKSCAISDHVRHFVQPQIMYEVFVLEDLYSRMNISGWCLQARGYMCPYLSKATQIVDGVGAGAMKSTKKPSAKKVP